MARPDSAFPLKPKDFVRTVILSCRQRVVRVTPSPGCRGCWICRGMKRRLVIFNLRLIFRIDSNPALCSRSQIVTLNGRRGSNLKYLPYAFTERGLYMLATVLKSARATRATLAIIETYAQVRSMVRSMVRDMEAIQTEKGRFTVATLSGREEGCPELIQCRTSRRNSHDAQVNIYRAAVCDAFVFAINASGGVHDGGDTVGRCVPFHVWRERDGRWFFRRSRQRGIRCSGHVRCGGCLHVRVPWHARRFLR